MVCNQQFLKQVFDAVCDQDDWKAPIQCSTDAYCLKTVVKAIKWFTGTVPEVRSVTLGGIFQ